MIGTSYCQEFPYPELSLCRSQKIFPWSKKFRDSSKNQRSEGLKYGSLWWCPGLTRTNLKCLRAVLVMGRDNVHGRDVQDYPVHGHELCNVQDMSRTFY